MVCAIHQPNFFPWLGFFDKIRRADIFVLLDDVLLAKSGSGMGSWSNRVRIDIQGEAHWFGCPLRREAGGQPLRAVRIDERQPWRKKLQRTLEMHYRRAPYFDETMALIAPLLDFPAENLVQYNINAIQALAPRLGFRARFVRQSALGIAGKGNELLIDLVKAVGASVYLSGDGADGYQRPELFAAQSIELVLQNFEARPYRDGYMPGLSVIDYLMHVAPGRLGLAGFAETAAAV